MDAARLQRIRDAAARSGGEQPLDHARTEAEQVFLDRMHRPSAAAPDIDPRIRSYGTEASKRAASVKDAKQPQSLADTRTPDETPEERIARIKREEDEAAMAQMSASFASRPQAPAAPKPQPKSAAEAANALALKFGIKKENQE